MQTDIFRSEEMQKVHEKIDEVEKVATSVRRGLFARDGAREKRVNELEDRIDEQDRIIYNLKKDISEIKKHLYPNEMSCSDRIVDISEVKEKI